jgi:hypothetical protein
MNGDTATAAKWTGAYRIVSALLAAVALGWQAHLITAAGRGLGNFFSFFTIQSNIVGIVVFGWGGVALLTGRAAVPDLLRGAAVVYLAITGVVYALLLSGLPGQEVAWVNTVVHQIMPIVFVLDWLIAPPRAPLPLRRVWVWLVFPLLYLVYTLARGPLVDWYPYPFLDPRPHGYRPVVVAVVGVAIGFVVATLLVWWVGGRSGRRVQSPTALR